MVSAVSHARPDIGSRALLLVLYVAFFLSSMGSLEAQETTEERIARLEKALEAERQRNDGQARRMRELELTIVNLTEAQNAAADEALLEARIQSVLSEELSRLEPRSGSSSESRLTVHGHGRFVMRAFGGDRISNDQSIELEHLIIQMELDLGDGLRIRAAPGVSHRGASS